MRIFERTGYLLGYLYIFSLQTAIDEISNILFIANLILILVSYFKEGLRLA